LFQLQFAVGVALGLLGFISSSFRLRRGLLNADHHSDCVYHFCEGHDATQHAAFGEASHIAITLRMHEEAAYEGLDPIESEIRRRVFWLLFDGEFSLIGLFVEMHETYSNRSDTDVRFCLRVRLQPTNQSRSYSDVLSR
jgi:hypothetical protein